ncbi:MAG: tRNA pseudouridine(38-40) synthase TruA [Aquaspirillum sp.]|nr:tRNA pseudouridine(38-40) synthase TruA [Aquaspirillum sp.]
MARIALGVEYAGSLYHGWQSQPDGNTVQDHLQTALSQIAGEAIAVIAAGRTDTGVHASGQVVHFDTEVVRPLSAWVRGVNRFLPPDIAVQWAHPVADHFHARFSAFARRYRYVLLNRPTRPALGQGQLGWFHAPLDLAAMQQAAVYLQGEHDFSCFRAAECQAKSPIKHLTRAALWQQDNKIIFEFQANAFLHHMVRNMVGALVYVGKGAHPPSWMQQLLAAKDRRFAPPTFMPDGLVLTAVGYPAEFALPAPCFSEE